MNGNGWQLQDHDQHAAGASSSSGGGGGFAASRPGEEIGAFLHGRRKWFLQLGQIYGFFMVGGKSEK